MSDSDLWSIADFETQDIAPVSDIYRYSDALEAVGRDDSAYRVTREIYRAQPTDGHAVRLLSAACRLSVRDDALIEQIRARHGRHPLAQAALSELDLIDGRYQSGFARCDARWSIAKGGRLRDRLPGLVWDGSPTDRLIVIGEQGLGEEFLFSAALADLPPATVACDPRLIPLFRRSFPQHRIVDRDMLATTRDDRLVEAMTIFASRNPPGNPLRWLTADAERAETIRAQFRAEFPGRRLIGLAWASARATLAKSKNVPPEALLPLIADPRTVAISLQYGDQRADLEYWRKRGVTVYALDSICPTTDQDGIAAMAAACDAVVTASCAVAHLAGALGVQTHVMLPGRRFVLWYWGRDGSRTPWYPSVTLHRARPDWPAAVASVMREIDKIPC